MEHHHTMHHNIQNSQGHLHHPIQWNYASPTTNTNNVSTASLTTSTPIGNNSSSSNHQTWTPPPSTRGLKRAMSESDCDDIYSEESSKEQ